MSNDHAYVLESESDLQKHGQSQSQTIATKNFPPFKLRQELQLTVINSLDSGRNFLLVRRNRDRLIKIASIYFAFVG